MKERPILFSAPMVRAILAGTKTVTRRIVKHQPQWGCVENAPDLGEGVIFWPRGKKHERWNNPCSEEDLKRSAGIEQWCPYGAPGDRLWVKEAIRKMEPPDMQHEDGSPVVYSKYIADDAWTVASAWPWKRDVLPGMFMPRGLRRITLEVVSVRVERLHDITEEDARAEGVEPAVTTRKVYPSAQAAEVEHRSYRDGFANLWRTINGADSWAANPFVWRIEFKRVEASC